MTHRLYDGGTKSGLESLAREVYWVTADQTATYPALDDPTYVAALGTAQEWYKRGLDDAEIDFAAQVDGTVGWLREGRWAVVNVAGNSEATAPGIEAFAEVFLRAVFAAALRAAAEDRQPLSPKVPPPMTVPSWAGRR